MSHNPPLFEYQRRQPYEDFTKTLWYAYKILTQRAARAAGLEIGFLYERPNSFEQGLANLAVAYPNLPPWFATLLRAQRAWQTKFDVFRGHREHEVKGGDEDDFRLNYEPAWAEEVFQQTWTVSAEILVFALALKLAPGLGIVNLPKELRDPHCPRRIRVIVHPDMIPK